MQVQVHGDMGTHRKGQPPPLDVVGVVDLGSWGEYIYYIHCYSSLLQGVGR